MLRTFGNAWRDIHPDAGEATPWKSVASGGDVWDCGAWMFAFPLPFPILLWMLCVNLGNVLW